MAGRIPEAILLMAAIAALCLVEFGGEFAAITGGAVLPTRVAVNEPPLIPVQARSAVEGGLAFLASAQQPDGGFGAGSHSAQNVRDPAVVQTDPATTAFAARAFFRAGSTLDHGPYSGHLRRALEYLLRAVEESAENDPSITNLRGTQPQSKLGQDVDVAFTAQVLGSILPLADNALRARTRAALDKCARKLARTQGVDGNWNGRGTWAGTLQSAMALTALEAAQSAGLDGYDDAVRRGRLRQQADLDPESGHVRAESSAGVALYAITSAQRAAAPEARAAQEAVDKARASGHLEADAPVSTGALEAIGYGRDEAEQLANAYQRNRRAMDLLRNDDVLDGFGSNGGEEYLSYMMTSESLLLTDGDEYRVWYQKISSRLSAIQNGNGSWSGHHCITSPVFCTAAVVLALTTELDTALRAQLAG